MTGTPTLVEFLRAQLDEDEQLARSALLGYDVGMHAAAGTPERPTPKVHWRAEYERVTQAGVMAWRGSVFDEGPVAEVAGGNYAAAAHIARHDPAHVLVEVAAKRALIDHVMSWRHDDLDEGGYHACPAVRTEPLGDLPFGEDECTCGLRLRQHALLAPFAVAHAEHPDYRADEWAP